MFSKGPRGSRSSLGKSPGSKSKRRSIVAYPLRLAGISGSGLDDLARHHGISQFGPVRVPGAFPISQTGPIQLTRRISISRKDLVRRQRPIWVSGNHLVRRTRYLRHFPNPPCTAYKALSGNAEGTLYEYQVVFGFPEAPCTTYKVVSGIPQVTLYGVQGPSGKPKWASFGVQGASGKWEKHLVRGGKKFQTTGNESVRRVGRCVGADLSVPAVGGVRAVINGRQRFERWGSNTLSGSGCCLTFNGRLCFIAAA